MGSAAAGMVLLLHGAVAFIATRTVAVPPDSEVNPTVNIESVVSSGAGSTGGTRPITWHDRTHSVTTILSKSSRVAIRPDGELSGARTDVWLRARDRKLETRPHPDRITLPVQKSRDMGLVHGDDSTCRNGYQVEPSSATDAAEVAITDSPEPIPTRTADDTAIISGEIEARRPRGDVCVWVRREGDDAGDIGGSLHSGKGERIEGTSLGHR